MAGGEGRRPVQIPAPSPAPSLAVPAGSAAAAAAMGAAAPPRRPRRSRLSGGGAGGGTSCAGPGRAGSGGSGRRSPDSGAPQARPLPVPGSVRVHGDRPWGRLVKRGRTGSSLPHRPSRLGAAPAPGTAPGRCGCSLGQGPPGPLPCPGAAPWLMQVALQGITPVVGEGG